MAHWAATWSPKRRHVSRLAGVRQTNGAVTTDPDEACKELGTFWANTFAKKPVDAKFADEFLRRWAVKLPSIDWKLTEEEFIKVIRSTGDTAPGPDGVPYAAWREAPKALLQTLYKAYVAWIQGGDVPDDFNFAYLTMIPKGEHEEDRKLIAREPGYMRPLSLSNSDCKLLANALKTSMENAVNGWASSVQRGFIRGRKMLQNIMDVETRAMEHAASLDHRAASIFVDFWAAFPSLSHEYLWLVLEHIGVSAPVIAAIQALYRSNRHWIRFGGVCVEVFTITSGVKQGCPLSPLLFVIALDPSLRALQATMGPRSLVRGYADDIALVLKQLWKEAPAVARLFSTLQAMAGLRLKSKKCVMIPLWSITGWGALKMLLREEIPSWGDFELDTKDKYLGVYLGPGAASLSWEGPLKKYVSRCAYIASLKVGLATSALLYRSLAVASLSFVMQICPIPAEVLVQEARALRRLAPGPGNWIPISAIHNLDKLSNC